MRTSSDSAKRGPELGFAVLVAIGIGTTFAAIQASGGSPSPFDQLIYLPILLAAYRWGWRGALTSALVAGFLLGPMLWLIGLDNGLEPPSTWGIRATAFAGVGALTGLLFDRVRRAVATERASAADIIRRDAESHRLAGRAERADDRLSFQASLLEEVQSAVIATDLDNRITYWNRAADAIYGWTSEEALGRNLHDLVSNDPDHAAAVPRAVVRDGKRWMGVMRDRRKDGSAVLTSVSAVPLRDAEGRIIGGIGTAADITHEEEAAREVRAAGQHLATVLDAAPQAMILIDASGLITHWNRRAEHEFGWRREEAVGRNAADLVAPPEMLEAARAGLAMLPTIAAGDLPEALPYVARDRNGTTFAVELTMAPVGTPDHPGYAVFITRTPSDS